MKLDYNYLSIIGMLFYIAALLLEARGSTLASIVNFIIAAVFLTGAAYEAYNHLKGTK